MKIVILLVLAFTSFFSYSKNQIQDFEPLDFEKILSDADTIKQQMDSTAYYINATYEILVLECKQFGLIETIRMNSSIFLPFLVFVGLYIYG